MLLDAHSLGEVVRVHRRALAGDILPALGAGVLHRYYAAMLQSGRAEIIGAACDGRLAGFVLVSFQGPSIGQSLRNSRGLLLRKLLRVAVARPAVLVDALLSAAQAARQSPAGSEIAYIAVDPDFQRRGVGSALVARLDALLASRNVESCRTKTLVDNAHLIALYSRFFARVEVTGTYGALRRRYMFLMLSRKDRSCPASVS